MTESCEFCAFFEQENDKIGRCRRNPPVPAFGASPTGGLAILGSGFTTTITTWWCGEWRKGTLVKPARAVPTALSFPGPGKN